MIIWRVENDKGEGCYVGQPTKSILHRHRNILTHPHPLADTQIARLPKIDEISGFESKTQANRWFSEEELKTLERHGFKLKPVKVKRITIKSRLQVLAIRETKESLAERLFANW